MSKNHDDLYDIDLLNDDLDHTHRDFRKSKSINKLNPFGNENELVEVMDLDSNKEQRPNPFSDENDILDNEDYLNLGDGSELANNTSTINLHQAQRRTGFLQRLLGRNPKSIISSNENNTYSSSNDIEMHSYTNLENMDDLHVHNTPNGAMMFINRLILGKDYEHEESTEPRTIELNDTSANAMYKNNKVSTTKYNFATFLPKFLFQEFSKYANLFFLFTAIIQQVPDVSPTNRYTTIGTLAVVLLVSAIKEGFEDLKRGRSDQELNNSPVDVFDFFSKSFETRKWNDLHVGDIIKLKSEESVPADIVLLSSSEPEGVCYIETANLDGETNLKIKQSKTETKCIKTCQDLALLAGTLVSEAPNSSLYTYEGTLEFSLNPSETKRKIALMPEQMILRGAVIRNTTWCYGIVVNTGHETKLMRNATSTPIKQTNVERVINMQIVLLFGILILFSFISSLGNIIQISIQKKHLGYLYLNKVNKAGLFFKNILTFWILYSNLVPISMFVTLEMIKYYQAWLIASDLDLYTEETDTPTVVRTSSLVEELGQIKYIFSDKTGTLTRNIMEFKSCSIAGKCYIEQIPEDQEAQFENGVEVGYHSFEEMFQVLNDGAYRDPSEKLDIEQFLCLLSLCHTVIPEVSEDGIEYQASSPDEAALVQGARDLGYTFTIRKPDSVVVKNRFTGESLEYELLNIIEFNSTRKRMSAIFKMPDGTIKLYCKGADTVILERLNNNDLEATKYVDATTKHLEDYAVEGLRTLCIAYKDLTVAEYEAWQEKYLEASTSLVNRSEKIDEVAELIERNLKLLGCTAIEDKLQDKVPETIQTLQDANIKIWVLTGDKQETAINIGMSCKLLSEEMNLLIVNEESKEDTRNNFIEKFRAFKEMNVSAQDMQNLALVIDGKSLGYALEPDMEDYLMTLGKLCKAVICCRVSPLQKALVVKMCKKKTRDLCLAIGDGANDVSMIQAAHVGVGINGMEGTQAARSADFAIGQFKHLQKLLLVHGSWSYQRISQAILYSFYKNIALYMTQFWYVFLNCFSGQSIMESWIMTYYNTFFTVMPPLVLGILDQFVSSRLLEKYPRLYKCGQNSEFFNVQIFWGWVINGFYHSAITFVGSILFYKYGNALHMHGQIADHSTWGVAVYTSSLVTVLGKAALVTNQWSKYTIIAIPGSLVFWLVFYPIYGAILPHWDISYELRGTISHNYGALTFWFMCFGLPVLCLLRDGLYKYYKRNYTPTDYHIIQEFQKTKRSDDDNRPRLEQFQKAIRKVRQVQRMKKQRGFAFSQSEEDNGIQERLIRLYDTSERGA
ncbi:probable Probable phospholipid-transporting ATPase DRS2 [Hanseniaspora guilliermondii]|uniref:Phospholipid-transporting ATPase n=1 Tax=Hanseniaspora guilliermondii TaxID=56406 RepID=A0A1L0AYB5_9ASCO|nr:probable Probable phospholipid-transporting ATPase DRS2 [Hanseniaspora guilliermondii]